MYLPKIVDSPVNNHISSFFIQFRSVSDVRDIDKTEPSHPSNSQKRDSESVFVAHMQTGN